MIKEHRNIIIAPHIDDELIGCFELLTKRPIIVYLDEQFTEERQKEALELKARGFASAQFFQHSIPPQLIKPTNTLYFPDPIFEKHYQHRKWGAIGEQLVRSGMNVIFYTINMEAPYTRHCKDQDTKKDLLYQIYPSQKWLWEMDHKYWLFEGRCRWLMG